MLFLRMNYNICMCLNLLYNASEVYKEFTFIMNTVG